MPNPNAPIARRPARNTTPTLRPHQRDALTAVVRELENPDPTAVGSARYSGRRATAVMACGTGKTWVAAATATTLAAHDRVLVLVPGRDLLVQTVRAWQRAGRVGGTQVAVCSFGGDAALGGAGVRATTSAPQLALWARADGPLTVYATYQSLGTILDAHTGVYGLRLAPWRLVCIDEGHRTSGSLAKEWGAVHDDRRLPAQGRLYLTATPRVWEPPANSTYSEGTGEGEAERPSVLADDEAWDNPEAAGPGGLDNLAQDEAGRDNEGDEDDEGGAGPIRVRGGRPIHSPLPLHAVASMENEEIFGPTVHRLELAAGVRLGLLAKPRIVVVDVADPTVQNLAEAGGLDLNRGPGRRTLEEVEEYRAARLAALQTAVLRVAADQELNTVIAYHARTAEAQACAETLPDVAKRLHETDPQRYPAAVWANWLCCEHETEHRRRVLGEFAAHTDREPAPLFEPTGRDEPARRWSLDRQRILTTVRLHTESGGSLDELVPGHTIGGEDIGAWLERQRRGGTGLTLAQREALAGVGVEVAEVPAQRAASVDRWALTLAAAAAFREREGHLTVPRKHVETVEAGGEAHRVKLGVAIANARQRQASWARERVDALTALGMRWV
ncbi:DEAD/DEAH box helicase family protein [Embleya sp. NBC_00896]|uniref:DEAD/DEAH box helicase family protein n=1 Tax=Embleya sp. NBC_00896 TaxID=2975961 RepID=UPI002F912812|nr:DEAD/DEAH box helicase family protein [Embleya sp. NBC_00896]